MVHLSKQHCGDWQSLSQCGIQSVMTAAKHPDGYGRATNECGDTVELSVELDGTDIAQVGLQANGCVYTLACAHAAAALARGKSLGDARREATPEAIAALIEGLPEHEIHCAEMACEALRRALEDAASSMREPWRKLYRTRR
jgi:nitrogen fixation NifU-like protein